MMVARHRLFPIPSSHARMRSNRQEAESVSLSDEILTLLRLADLNVGA
jgi:hypothetical protein